MNERLKELRRTLKLSQQDFGSKLGITKASISRLESGVNNFTEQMIKSICREFNVNYEWLTTGEGDMFNNSNNSTLSLISSTLNGNNNFAKNVFTALAKLTDTEWFVLEKIFNDINTSK